MLTSQLLASGFLASASFGQVTVRLIRSAALTAQDLAQDLLLCMCDRGDD